MPVLAQQLSPLGVATRRREAAGYSPLALSPAVWYDASQITGKSDGDYMPTLPDFSGNGHDGAIMTAGSHPTYKESAVGGMPAVNWIGSPPTGQAYKSGAPTP